MGLRDGLVGAWCPSLLATAGTLLDRSGRNNHGTLTNMDPATDWVQSGGRGALDFDGTNDQVNTTASVPTGNARSVSCWVLTRSVAAGEAWAFSAGYSNVNQAIMLGRVAATLYVTQYGAAIFGGTLVTNQWFHIATSHTGTVWRLHLNGVQTATGTMATTPTAHPVFIGSVDGSLFWNGQIDDVAVWQRELTLSEIRQLYTQGRGAWLRQTRRQTYGFVAAGFRPYWARRQSQIIGGGT